MELPLLEGYGTTTGSLLLLAGARWASSPVATRDYDGGDCSWRLARSRTFLPAGFVGGLRIGMPQLATQARSGEAGRPSEVWGNERRAGSTAGDLFRGGRKESDWKWGALEHLRVAVSAYLGSSGYISCHVRLVFSQRVQV